MDRETVGGKRTVSQARLKAESKFNGPEGRRLEAGGEVELYTSNLQLYS
jgi:hypothetical protein